MHTSVLCKFVPSMFIDEAALKEEEEADRTLWYAIFNCTVFVIDWKDWNKVIDCIHV